MAAATGWARGQFLMARVFEDHALALQMVVQHNNCSDGRKAKWFKRQVKAGRASVGVTMVVVRAAINEVEG